MIKRVPEDFVVEERADLPLRPAGEYRVYELRKSGWTTLDLLHHLARVVRLSPELFTYGGKKDKHGLTSQFIAVRDAHDIGLDGEGFSLRAVGTMDRPMGPDLIAANSFKITVRDLGGVEDLEHNLAEVGRSGFPNFFDDQRFRSYDPERGFFAERILKRHWNGALQTFLTSAAEGASGEEKRRKARLFEAWKDWEAGYALARERLEREILGFLLARPKDYRGALRLIPEEEIGMRYSAFQSHLWNELLRRLLARRAGSLEEVRGREGSYLFWRRLSPAALGYFRRLDLPTAAARVEPPDDLSASLYAAILEEKGLRPGMFRTKDLRRVGFRSFARSALIAPESPQVLGTGADELHPGRKKWTVSFSLPRGAYGTMLIKRLELAPAPDAKES